VRCFIAIWFIVILAPAIGVAQDSIINIIKQNLSNAKHDTSRVLRMTEIASYYKLSRPDSALRYGYNALSLSKQINFPDGELNAMQIIIITLLNLGNDSKALQMTLQAEKIAEINHSPYYKATIILERGKLYVLSKDYAKALDRFSEAHEIFDSLKNIAFSSFAQYKIGETYLAMGKLDSALYYCQAAHDSIINTKYNWASAYALLGLGKIHDELGNTDLAISYSKQCRSKALVEDELIFASYINIAQSFRHVGKLDSSVIYANKSLETARETGFFKHIIEACILLSDLYEKADPQQALLFSKKAISYKDSLNSLIKSTAQEAFIDFEEQERQREIEVAKSESQDRIRMNAFLGSTFTLSVIAFFLYRNNKIRQKAKQNIEKAYNELKSTQSQLIQS